MPARYEDGSNVVKPAHTAGARTLTGRLNRSIQTLAGIVKFRPATAK